MAVSLGIRAALELWEEMIKVSILYPRDPDGWFDFDYYTRKHMPRSIALLSAHPGFRAASVERGVEGAEPKSAPAYVAGCFFTFDTVDSFLRAFAPHAVELQTDIPNYTDIEPLIQFNEVLIAVPEVLDPSVRVDQLAAVASLRA